MKLCAIIARALDISQEIAHIHLEKKEKVVTRKVVGKGVTEKVITEKADGKDNKEDGTAKKDLKETTEKEITEKGITKAKEMEPTDLTGTIGEEIMGRVR